MPNPARIVVQLLHCNPVVSAGLQAVLRNEHDFELLPGGGPSPAVSSGYAGRAPCVVVADHRQGLQQVLGDLGSRCRVLVVEAVSRGWAVRTALQAGVLGYAAVDCPLPELIQGVRSVERGTRFLCASASQAMADSFAVGEITARELDVLRLLGSGLDNKSISRQLDIALSTVKVHVQAVLAKLNASSRTEAAVEAMRLGVIELHGERA
jgi:DNA-binding NarL/FixJ family response regulator